MPAQYLFGGQWELTAALDMWLIVLSPSSEKCLYQEGPWPIRGCMALHKVEKATSMLGLLSSTLFQRN